MFNHGDYMYCAASNKPDQQVPSLGSQNPDPTPLLEEILTQEQNTCIQIRDTCTLMAQSVRDVLGSACPQVGYVQVMQDKLGQLEKAVNSLETTIKRKAVFPNEFLDSASQRWFEKRLSSQSRKRRLRNFKRKDGAARIPNTDSDSPPTTPSYSFMLYDEPRTPSPSSPPSVPSPPNAHVHTPPQLPTLSIPHSSSPSNSPRKAPSSARGSPAACVPSTPSYTPISAPVTPTIFFSQERMPLQASDSQLDEKRKSMSVFNMIN